MEKAVLAQKAPRAKGKVRVLKKILAAVLSMRKIASAIREKLGMAPRQKILHAEMEQRKILM